MERLKEVIVDSFGLLRRQPSLFLPKILIVGVWSFVWIYVIGLLFNPYMITLDIIAIVMGIMLFLAPFQVWVNNFYFVLVEQESEGRELGFYDAFIEGFMKVPRGIAAFFISIAIGLIASLPGSLIVFMGLIYQNWVVAAIGALIILITSLIITVMFYFTPVSVVVGEDAFFKDFKKGLHASSENRIEVSLIVIVSFVLLLLSNAFEGALGFLGVVGFFIGRLISAVVSVYILLMNPEFFLRVND